MPYIYCGVDCRGLVANLLGEIALHCFILDLCYVQRILFSHKINKSYKCILMLRATHGHLASKNENKQQKNIWTMVRSHDRGHSGQGGLVLVSRAVCFNTHELVW